MKYIRTKDKKGKQYIVSDRDYIFQIRDNKVIFARGYEEELLGQTNTISELCDEFVVKVNVHNVVLHDLDSALRWTKDYGKYELTKDYVIYGAIWTDKGLIYVAKMNEKGELELL